MAGFDRNIGVYRERFRQVPLYVLNLVHHRDPFQDQRIITVCIQVGNIFKRHNTKYYCYAGDTKVSISLKTFDKLDNISSSMEACITDISIQVTSNMLKLNKAKIELTVFSSAEPVEN